MKQDQIAAMHPIPNFRVSCEAGEQGSLQVATDQVTFTIAQRICVKGEDELHESVQLRCHKENDGRLTVQVLLFNPEVENPLQIALLTSQPDASSPTRKSLECNLIPEKIY
jgi:hypothetical protein